MQQPKSVNRTEFTRGRAELVVTYVSLNNTEAALQKVSSNHNIKEKKKNIKLQLFLGVSLI